MRRWRCWFFHGAPSPEKQDDGTLLANRAHNIRELFYLRGALADNYMLLQCIRFQGMVFAKMPGGAYAYRAYLCTLSGDSNITPDLSLFPLT